MNEKKKSAAQEILEADKKATEGLRRFYQRINYEPTTHYTPLDSVISAEEGDYDEFETQKETVTRMLLYFAAMGMRPMDLLRRLMALGAHMGVEPYCKLTLREKRDIFGGSHGMHHWLTNRACVEPLRKKGARNWKAPGQKSLASRGNFSQCQKGNSNRTKNKADKP